MPLISNESYIDELSLLQAECKRKLDEATANATGAADQFKSAQAEKQKMKLFWENIQGTNDKSRPVIASLQGALELINTVTTPNTRTTVKAHALLLKIAHAISRHTELLESRIQALSVLIQNQYRENPGLDPSNEIKAGLETLLTNTQAAREAAQKAYELVLIAYRDILLFNTFLNTRNTSRSGAGDIRDGIEQMQNDVGAYFPMDEKGDTYFTERKAAFEEAESNTDTLRQVSEQADRAKNLAQTRYDSISASVTAATEANSA